MQVAEELSALQHEDERMSRSQAQEEKAGAPATPVSYMAKIASLRVQMQVCERIPFLGMGGGGAARAAPAVYLWAQFDGKGMGTQDQMEKVRWWLVPRGACAYVCKRTHTHTHTHQIDWQTTSWARFRKAVRIGVRPGCWPWRRP